MNKKIAAIAAIAILSAISVVSCGNDVEQDSVSVALPKVTVAQDEKATTEAAETTKADKKTTAVVVSGSDATSSGDEDTTKDTETTAADSGEDTTENGGSGGDQQVIEAPTEQETEPAPAVVPGRSDLVFSYGTLLGDASGTVSALGTPNSTATAAGCLTNGADQKIYYYNTLTLLCYESGGAEYIYDVKVTGGDFATDKGIRIGSSRDDVIAAYGGDGSFYSEGNKELSFYYSGDTVSSFEYYAAV